MKLINKNLSVSEQFLIRDNIVKIITKYYGKNPDYEDIDVEKLLLDTGIKCYYNTAGGRLSGFEVVDSEAFLAFKLKYCE